MNPNERFIQFLGLIKKAGKLAVGRMAVDRAVWSGKAYLLLLELWLDSLLPQAGRRHSDIHYAALYRQRDHPGRRD